jgi:hypothetical protein
MFFDHLLFIRGPETKALGEFVVLLQVIYTLPDPATVGISTVLI